MLIIVIKEEVFIIPPCCNKIIMTLVVCLAITSFSTAVVISRRCVLVAGVPISASLHCHHTVFPRGYTPAGHIIQTQGRTVVVFSINDKRLAGIHNHLFLSLKCDHIEL